MVGTKKLEVEISNTLYDRFYGTVITKKGPWRGRKEQAYKATHTAVEAALEEFLDSLENKEGDDSSSD
jgi:hypothetical protein